MFETIASGVLTILCLCGLVLFGAWLQKHKRIL